MINYQLLMNIPYGRTNCSPYFLFHLAPVIDPIDKASFYGIIFVIAHHQVFLPLGKLPPATCIHAIEIGFIL